MPSVLDKDVLAFSYKNNSSYLTKPWLRAIRQRTLSAPTVLVSLKRGDARNGDMEPAGTTITFVFSRERHQRTRNHLKQLSRNVERFGEMPRSGDAALLQSGKERLELDWQRLIDVSKH